MSAPLAARVPNAGGEDKPSLFVITTCGPCGATVTEVRDRSSRPVQLDGRDPGGDWAAVKVAGQWRVSPITPGQTVSAGSVRYKRHECPAVVVGDAFGDLSPVAEEGGHAMRTPTTALSAPCAGGCGGEAYPRYGAGARTLCEPCGDVLKAYRATAAEHRGPVIPYGRWVDGEYIHRVSESCDVT